MEEFRRIRFSLVLQSFFVRHRACSNAALSKFDRRRLGSRQSFYTSKFAKGISNVSRVTDSKSSPTKQEWLQVMYGLQFSACQASVWHDLFCIKVFTQVHPQTPDLTQTSWSALFLQTVQTVVYIDRFPAWAVIQQQQPKARLMIYCAVHGGT